LQTGTIAGPVGLNLGTTPRDSGRTAAAGELSDAAVRDLLDRLIRRDERAMRELHGRYGRRIYLFAVARLRDEDAAETVMIDTLFEVWKHPDRFRGESRFSTWLLGIAKYKVLNAFRSAEPEHEDVEDYAEIIADPNADVAGAMENKQRQRILMECIEMLSAPQRECMQLVLLEGLALAEVATLQKVPEGTVKTRLFHGRKNLRDCVQSKGAGGE
jgi:RNA polymerase sigma-70 factor (ECF subfamily)